MDFSQYFPFFDKLTAEEQSMLLQSTTRRFAPAGTILHDGSGHCLGLLLIRTGQLRAYISSDEGKEITIYRLFERDICLLSASCIMRNIQFDITICAEKDTQLWVIPVDIYKKLTEHSAAAANYTNEIMAARFTDAMWLIEQITWKSFDKRLASFLIEESTLEESSVLKITHEKIASHLGTAREVVTRMLKYFQDEGMVRLSRGSIEITNLSQLLKLDPN